MNGIEIEPLSKQHEVGNASVNTIYSDLAICDYGACSERGNFFKCYRPCFSRCNIYKEGLSNSNLSQENGLGLEEIL